MLGGNGYVEDSGMPRLYREMPVNSIWEGSGNVMCIDVLRAATRTPDSLDAVTAEAENRQPAWTGGFLIRYSARSLKRILFAVCAPREVGGTACDRTAGAWRFRARF